MSAFLQWSGRFACLRVMGLRSFPVGLKSILSRLSKTNLFRALDLHDAGVMHDDLNHAEAQCFDLAAHGVQPGFGIGGQVFRSGFSHRFHFDGADDTDNLYRVNGDLLFVKIIVSFG